jgi:hypothetical protein
VISEIMYHPGGDADPALPASFIELANLAATNVALFDSTAPDTTWRLREGLSFAFPPGAILSAGGRLLVVGFDPVTNAAALAAFRALYTVPSDTAVYGPWEGGLANDQDTVELASPDTAGPDGVPYLRMDKVHYSAQAPWPADADGTGASLQRRTLGSYGNEPTNWFAATPTAGAANHPNVPPTLQLTAPSPGAVFQVPTNVLLTAAAEDSDGRIVRVEFHADNQQLAELTAVPYTFVWTNPPPGTHLLRAVAVDDRLGSTTSGTTTITVIAPPPSVRLVAPADGTMRLAGGTIELAAEAESSAGRIDRVRLLAGTTLLTELLAPPYVYSWSAVPSGAYALQAVAVDVWGTVSTSSVVRVGIAPGTTTATTLLPTGSPWKYLDDGSIPDAAWTGLGFDDSGWKSGPAELGYGDAGEGRPEATQIRFGSDETAKYITYYFRQTLNVTNAASFQDLTIGLLRDDGAVVYLNGTEVFRSNLPDGPIASNTLALAAVAGVEETSFFTQSVSPALVREGPNVLAVEVHQVSAGSSDLSFDLVLSGTRVALAPVILAQPESRAVPRGANVTFAGWVGGTAPLAYQWRFNRAPLGGATNATLTLTNVQATQAGAYQFVVTNALGATESEGVTLTLTNRPPVAVADGIVVPRAQTAFVSFAALTANDSDPDGDTIQFKGAGPTSQQGGHRGSGIGPGPLHSGSHVSG